MWEGNGAFVLVLIGIQICTLNQLGGSHCVKSCEQLVEWRAPDTLSWRRHTQLLMPADGRVVPSHFLFRAAVCVALAAFPLALSSARFHSNANINSWMQVFMLCYTRRTSISLCLFLRPPSCLAFLLFYLSVVNLSPRLSPHHCHSYSASFPLTLISVSVLCLEMQSNESGWCWESVFWLWGEITSPYVIYHSGHCSSRPVPTLKDRQRKNIFHHIHSSAIKMQGGGTYLTTLSCCETPEQ